MRSVVANAEQSAPIDVAREATFTLGQATVRPPLGEVRAGAQVIRLQPRVMQVLVALVRAGGEVVSRDELVASCWDGVIVGDDAINRCVGRLRRLAEDEAPGSFTIETFNKIGYRLTPAGWVDAGATRPFTRRRTGLWIFGAIASFIAIVLATAAWLGLGRPGWPQPRAGVAVMPFSTAPGDPFARSFADGVADEVASALASADLKALPADAVAGLTGSERDEAALRLGAAFTLGGRVQRDGDDLNVSVAIDDALRRNILWSAEFNRPAAQAQAMQEQIAAKVADVLHCAVDASNFKGGQIDRGALRLYLRACDLVGRSDLGGRDLEQARDLFAQVVKLEPTFAAGWANLALSTAVTAGSAQPDQAVAVQREAQTYAQKALQLDPNNGMAYVALEVIDLRQRSLSRAPEPAAQGAERCARSRDPELPRGLLVGAGRSLRRCHRICAEGGRTRPALLLPDR